MRELRCDIVSPASKSLDQTVSPFHPIYMETTKPGDDGCIPGHGEMHEVYRCLELHQHGTVVRVGSPAESEAAVFMSPVKLDFEIRSS